MKALAQASRLGLKSPLQPKAGSARHGKPVSSVPRGGLQLQAISSGSGPLAPLYQLADGEVTALPPAVLDAVVDAPPPAALEAAEAATQAISASSVAPDTNAVATAVEAMTETFSVAATAAVSAASDAVAAATDVLITAADVVTDVVSDTAEAAAEAVTSTAAAASEAVADVVSAATSAVEVAADAVSSSTTTGASEAVTDVMTATASTVAAPAAAPAAPQTLSLAAQRYAEMTSKAPKIAPGGGGSSGAAGFQAPSFSMPDMSGIQLPKLSAPDFSKLSAPDLSKLSVPELPKLPAAASGLNGEGGILLPNIDFNTLELPATPTFDVPDVGSAVGGAASEVSSAAAAAAAGVSAAAAGALSGVTSAINATASSAATALNGATGGLLAELDRELGGVNSAVQSVTDAVGNSVGAAAGQVYSALPPQAQVIARDVGDVVYAFVSHPASSLVLAGLVGVPVGIKSYMDRYGGYSGDLSPATVKELLIKEDVLVVDVRTDDERQESGVLDLRKGARFSAAALPADLVAFPPKWARESKAGERLATTTTALLISRLNRIRTPLTKVVIMNNNDDLAARELARAVRAAGVLRVYVMAGGFQAWSAAGLGVMPGKTDYEASALVVLLDEVADIAAVVGPKLREPVFLATTLATSSIVLYAAVNYHTTLRYFAVWGVFATIYWRLSRYNSPQEFFEDVKAGALTAASSATSAASAAARAAASAATSKPPVLAAAAVPALPAAALAAAAPAAPAPPAPAAPAPAPPVTSAVQLPPPPPTEASPAALAAAMAAAGVAPLSAVPEPSPSADALPAADAAAAPAPAPAAVAESESAALTAAPALPFRADATGDTTISPPADAAAIAASAAAPASPVSNGNGIAKADKLVTSTEPAKEAVPVMTSEPSAPAPGAGETRIE